MKNVILKYYFLYEHGVKQHLNAKLSPTPIDIRHLKRTADALVAS